MPYCFVNGIRLRYETWGEGQRSLVLLHGLGSSADDWLLQLPAFGTRYRCLAADLRGHGLSDKPAGRYSIALFAEDIAGLLKALGIATAHILGLSLGGLVAQQLAIRFPEHVRSLTLINTFPGLWPPTPALARMVWQRRVALLRRPDMAAIAARVAADLFPHPDLALLRRRAEAQLAVNDPEAYRRATSAVVRFWPGRQLRRVKCPALIVVGERDNIVPRVYQERLRRLLPHAQYVVIPDSGHASNIDQPEKVNAAVLAFLAEVDDG